MERHARIAVLLDRLESIWHICVLEDRNLEYQPVDEAWRKDLTTELQWLHDLYAEALANEGDVRAFLMAHAAEQPPVLKSVKTEKGTTNG
jgi:hypothetical protein